ncbi:MAG: undecaprenyl-phosphate glucose phosphotransferase [Nitrospirota bacterium]|nr:undecaprenyl-phosphate glucose phosphotransferase [Nitrospirota bacterium]
MLRRHSEFFKNLLFFSDLFLISSCWVAAYFLRFSVPLFPVTKGIPPIEPYLWLLVPIILVWGICFSSLNLYRPRRMGSHLAEFVDLAKANALCILILVALTFFLKTFEFSRLVILYFWLLNLVVLGFSRMVFREILRLLRRLGYNQRHVVVIGAGALGQRVAHMLQDHPELGMNVRGYLSRNEAKVGQALQGAPVLGTFDQAMTFLTPQVDVVFLCLPPAVEGEAERLMKILSTTTAEVKIIPSIYEFITLRAEAEIFDGLPIITLQGSPLYGWNLFLKRAFDVAGSLVALGLTLPLMALIAAFIALTSPGSVLYRQKRIGLDGRSFEIIKFRTMELDAESKTGPIWAQAGDARCTAIGKVLRRTSLDELPQFWNVLKGEMSIVGPRPERPEFIHSFREQFPQYNLRHKMKAGITGWAQVNGLRGNTSWEKRLALDMYYIEHWSLWLDVKIMLLTCWKGFIHKEAY